MLLNLLSLILRDRYSIYRLLRKQSCFYARKASLYAPVWLIPLVEVLFMRASLFMHLCGYIVYEPAANRADCWWCWKASAATPRSSSPNLATGRDSRPDCLTLRRSCSFSGNRTRCSSAKGSSGYRCPRMCSEPIDDLSASLRLWSRLVEGKFLKSMINPPLTLLAVSTLGRLFCICTFVLFPDSTMMF